MTISLLALSGIFWTSNIHAQAKTEKQLLEQRTRTLREAVVLVKKLRTILDQERTRWAQIHANPIPDKIKVTYNDAERQMLVHVTIAPRVENVVNKQAITRTYTFKYDPDKSLFDPIDLFLGVGWIYVQPYPGNSFRLSDGYRPFIGAGIRIIKSDRISGSGGVGVYTSILSTGATLYYSPKQFPRLSVHLFAGMERMGGITGGIGVGARL